jgi:dTDP-4-dehydrorhamnose reductase
MRAFIFGSKGQLGRAFAKRFEKEGWEYLGADSDELDVTNPMHVAEVLSIYRPGLIINCSAYNQVDLAENDRKTAMDVNAYALRSIAMEAKKFETTLVHFSTDYVFDGSKKAPYTEQDKTNPLNVYGESKLAGEKYALEPMGASVFRLSWLYGDGKQNFIYKVRQWAEKEGPLKIADDEISVPTYTEDVVDAVMAAMQRGLSGLWHLPNSGFCSRYEWAKEILRLAGIKKEIIPAKMADFNTAAKRPGYSAMSNAALCRELGIKIPDWRDSLARFLSGKR